MAIKKKTMASTGTPRETNHSLIGGGAINFPSLKDTDLKETTKYNTRYIPLTKIDDNRNNPFEMVNTFYLEQSIARLGILQPAIVIRKGDRYEIKAGSRRFKCITNLYEKAMQDGDETNIEKFSAMFCLILPDGATEKEIDQVIKETNTTARQLSISDLFKNFDLLFEKNEQGEYKYLPSTGNKYEAGAQFLKELGFDYSTSSVKHYLSIYTSKSDVLKEDLKNGALGVNQALLISRLPQETQDQVVLKTRKMDTKETQEYLKKEQKKKVAKKTQIRGSELLAQLNQLSKSIAKIQSQEYAISSNKQRNDIVKKISDIEILLQEVNKVIKESNN